MRTVLRWLLPLFFLPSHCLFLQRAHHFTLANTDHLHIDIFCTLSEAIDIVTQGAHTRHTLLRLGTHCRMY
ncbi:hypothetical protein L210DRAFT_3523800 [Boletus edulis BED1]|uniref:Secreted protein n=1 Tax=Boletus edulis BED1 TaxID=1328754 RepID=A0AAD4C4X3_BOLED|nr:hypothetical protein L210DRAFT_3523800 [Boletus edulis BED1]